MRVWVIKRPFVTNNTVSNCLSWEADRKATEQFTLFGGKMNAHDRNICKSYKFSYIILNEIIIILTVMK